MKHITFKSLNKIVLLLAFFAKFTRLLAGPLPSVIAPQPSVTPASSNTSLVITPFNAHQVRGPRIGHVYEDEYMWTVLSLVNACMETSY
jgi:hypothetical protein